MDTLVPKAINIACELFSLSSQTSHSVDPGVWVSPTTAETDLCTKPRLEPKGEDEATGNIYAAEATKTVLPNTTANDDSFLHSELPNTSSSTTLQSEDRDEPDWVEEIYHDTADTAATDDGVYADLPADTVDPSATDDTVVYADLPTDRVDSDIADDTALYADLPNDTVDPDDTVVYVDLPTAVASANLQLEGGGEPDWVEDIYDDTVGFDREGKKPGTESMNNPIYSRPLGKGIQKTEDASQSDCAKSTTTTVDLATHSVSEPICNESKEVSIAPVVIEDLLQQYPRPMTDAVERQPFPDMLDDKSEQPLCIDITELQNQPHLHLNEATPGSACGCGEAVTSM